MIYEGRVEVCINLTYALRLGSAMRRARQKCFCRAPWKIGLGNSLILATLAMQIVAPCSNVFLPGGNFLGRHLGERRGSAINGLSMFFSGRF